MLSMQILQPNELKPLLDPKLRPAREALCEDPEFKKIHNDSIELLKAKNNESKHEAKERENKEFFELLTFNAELEQYNKLMTDRYNARQQMEQAIADAKQERKASFEYEEVEAASEMTEESQPHASKDTFVKAAKLDKQITEQMAKLTHLNADIKKLNDALLNRQAHMTQAIQKSGQVQAGNLANAMVQQLNQTTNIARHTQAAINAGDDKQVHDLTLLQQEIERTIDELQPTMAKTLANSAAPENLLKHIKPLDEACAREEKRLVVKVGPHDAKKQAMRKVVGNRGQMLDRINIVGGALEKNSIRNLKTFALALNHLPPALRNEIANWQVIGITALLNSNPNSKNVFQKHSQTIFDANDLFIDKRAQLHSALLQQQRLQEEVCEAINELNRMFMPSQSMKRLPNTFSTEIPKLLK